MRIYTGANSPTDSSNATGQATGDLAMPLVVSLAVFVLLLISEVPFDVSLIASAIFAFQIYSGGSLLILICKHSTISWQEFCGVGISLGSLLTLVLDQVFRATPVSQFAWVAPFFLIVLVSAKYRTRQNLRFSLTKNQLFETLYIFGIVFLLLTPEWFWTLPFAAFLLIASIQNSEPRQKLWLIPAGLLALSASIFSVMKRPVGWWIEDSDFALYEAISKTLSIWGFRDNINAAGTSTNYHWFAYAWAGLVDRITSAPPWVSNTRIVPVMIVVGITLISWAILERLNFSRNVIIGSLIVIGCFDTIQSWGRGFKIGIIASPSQIYGTLLILLFLYFFILFNDRNLKFSLGLLVVIAFSVVGAKVAHGAILAGAIGTVWLFELLKTKTLYSHQSIQALAVLVAIYSSFFFVIGGGGGSSRGMLFDQAAFVDGITGDFRAYGLVVHWIAALILLFGMYGTQMFGVIAIIYFYSNEHNYIKHFAIGTAITGFLSAIFLSGEFAVEIFFTHAASSVLIVLITPVLIRELFAKHRYSTKTNLLAIAVSGLIGVAIAANLPDLNSGSITAIILRTLPSIVGLLPIGCALLLTRRFRYKVYSEPLKKPFLILALTGLMTLSISFYTVNFVKNIVVEYPSFETNYKNRTGEDLPDLIQASAWINENVSESEILATNDFCREVSESCNPDTDWNALLKFSMKCTTDEVLRSDDCNAGGYPLLTAIVDRRFLAGNYYVGISDGSAIKPWVVDRVLDSVDFAKDPSLKSTQKLTSQGVDWFLLRRNLTDETDWSNFGSVEYSNNTYLMIKLAKG